MGGFKTWKAPAANHHGTVVGIPRIGPLKPPGAVLKLPPEPRMFDSIEVEIRAPWHPEH